MSLQTHQQHTAMGRTQLASSVEPKKAAPHRALFVADILIATFEQLESRSSLWAASMTCRAWAATGIPMLWRAPTIDALLSVPNGYHRNVVGASVRHVLLLLRPEVHLRTPLDGMLTAFRLHDWRFGGARSIEISAQALYVHLNAFLPVIARCGPRVTMAAVRYMPAHDYIRACARYSFYADDDADQTKGPADERLLALLHELSKRRKLANLTIELPLRTSLLCALAASGRAAAAAFASDMAMLSRVSSSVGRGSSGPGNDNYIGLQFPSLRELSVRLCPRAIPAFLKSALVSKLCLLDLVILPALETYNIIRALAIPALTRNLTTLRLMFTEAYQMNSCDVAGLQKFKHLTELRVQDGYGMLVGALMMRAPDLNDAVLERLVAQWPHMTVLELQLTSKLTTAAVCIIGVACRRLRVLELEGTSCSPKEFGRGMRKKGLGKEQLFPELRELRLRSAANDKSENR